MLNACSGTLTTADVDISNCAEHGIELKGSTLDASTAAALSGTGNVGAGVYLRSNSRINYVDGYVPTITGTVGDIAITDPTLQEKTWAEIDAADGLDYVNEATIRKVS